jgi:prefoldin subunit 5
MAATTGLPSAILGPLAPPLASTGAPPTAAAATAATSSTVKSMKQLMDEIDQAKIDFENTIKPLEKIETGRKKTVSSHDQAVQGRTKIREFNERVLSLQNQITAMTKETDPTYDKNLFDRTKKNGQKSLTDLSHKIDRVDKHLEKATGKTSTTTAPSAGTHSTPPVVSTAVTEGENTKGIGSILNRLPLIRKKAPSKVPVATTTPETVPTPAKPADEAGDAARKTTNDKAASDDDDEEEEVEEEEESDDDDDDVISDKKKGKKRKTFDIC